MNPQPVLLALDYGGTKLAAGCCAAEIGTPPQWLARAHVISPSGASAQDNQTAMLRAGRALLTKVGGDLRAIGVSFGGPVDFAHGIVRLSPHVPGWEGVRLCARLEQELGAPCRMDNDGNAAALGEWKLGAGRGCRDLLYVTVSTGIGAGWILNGVPYRGADGMAGEIGHTIIVSEGERCVCGKHGCLEAEAAGPAIAAKYRRLAGVDAAEQITGESVARAAQQGDPLAAQALDQAAQALGRGLANALNLMNPERLVIGGGVSKSGERYWQSVRDTARQYALPSTRVDIVPAQLGDDAPLWGAAVLAASSVPMKPARSRGQRGPSRGQDLNQPH